MYRPAPTILTVAVATAALSIRAHAVPAIAIWHGGNADWYAADVWTIPPASGFNPEDMPDHPDNTVAFQFDVFIDDSAGPSIVQLSSAFPTKPHPEISRLFINPGDELSLENTRQLTIDTPTGGLINNAGTLSINDTARLILDGGGGEPPEDRGTLLLTGGGTLHMRNPGATITASGNNPRNLINEAHTITGGGLITDLGITNRSVIEANNALLIIDPAFPATVNNEPGGELRAVNMGLLELKSGTYNNQGTIAAEPGAIVQLGPIATFIGGDFIVQEGGFLNAKGTVTLDSINLNGNLNVTDGSTANLKNTINNNGLIEADTNTPVSTTIAIDGDVTLQGTGTLRLVNPIRDRLANASGTPKLTNASGHTIAGAGDILSLDIVNDGTISADIPGNPLKISLTSGGILKNNGQLEAKDGGTLSIQNTTVDNKASGSIIEAKANSFVTLSNANILGGGLFAPSPSASGAIQVNGTGTRFDMTEEHVSIAGLVQITNGSTLTLVGRSDPSPALFQNIFGTLLLDSGGPTPQNTFLFLTDGDVRLTLNGTIQLTDSDKNFFIQPIDQATPHTLINSNNTIKGAGHIGGGGFHIQNHHDIIAEFPGNPLVVKPAIGELGDSVNTGTIFAENGATLRFEIASPFKNAGEFSVNGVISAVEEDSILDIRGTASEAESRIEGGIVSAADGGIATLRKVTLQDLELISEFTGDVDTRSRVINESTATLANIKLNGTFIANQATTTTIGAATGETPATTGLLEFADGAEFYLNADTAPTTILLPTEKTTIKGNGTLITTDSAKNTITASPTTDPKTLDIRDGATILAAGNINNLYIDLFGRIEHTAANPLTFDLPPATNTPGDREGIEIGVGGTLHSASPVALGGVFIKNNRVAVRGGTVEIAAGSSIFVAYNPPPDALDPAAYRQTAGRTTIDGTLTAHTTIIEGGLLDGAANIVGELIDLRGTTLFAPGKSPGIATIDAAYAQGPDTTLQIELQAPPLMAPDPVPGADHDQLNITGPTTLNGTLEIVLLNPTSLPPLGTEYTVITYGTRTAASMFHTITGTLINATFALAPLFTDSDDPDTTDDHLILRASVPGDLNFDNKVSIADLSTFALNFNTTLPGAGLYNETTNTNSWQLGDFNTDGAVTVADLSLLALNFGFDATDPANPVPGTGDGLTFAAAARMIGIDPTAIPEPATLAVLAPALLLLTNTNPRKSALRRPQKHR